MASGQGAASPSSDEGLAELVRRIQSGDQAAIREFRVIFSAGIEFLLRRTVEKQAVATEAAGVLEAAVREIRESSQAEPVNLRRTVANIIHLRFGAAESDTEAQASGSSDARLADSVLAKRTPLERDILRRYYVLGESPDTIQADLRVGAQTVEQVIASARADFRRGAQGTGSN
jgi:DNA-directed RNA polymerase specialized sigma24 family protein